MRCTYYKTVRLHTLPFFCSWHTNEQFFIHFHSLYSVGYTEILQIKMHICFELRLKMNQFTILAHNQSVLFIAGFMLVLPVQAVISGNSV